MKILLGDRGSGKSTHVIEWLAENPDRRIVLASNMINKRTLMFMAERMFPDLDVDWNKRIIHLSTVHQLRGLPEFELMIDDVDLFLGALIGHEVAAATMTGEVDVLVDPQLMGFRPGSSR